MSRTAFGLLHDHWEYLKSTTWWAQPFLLLHNPFYWAYICNSCDYGRGSTKNAPATQFGYHCIFSLMLSDKCCCWEVKRTAMYKWYQWLKRLNDQAWKQMEDNKSSLLGEVAILDSAFKKRKCTQRTKIHYKILYTHYVFVFPTGFFFQNVHTHAHIYIFLPNSSLLPHLHHTENKGQLSF